MTALLIIPAQRDLILQALLLWLGTKHSLKQYPDWLKGIALFARDKADKEHKDACDLYSLLQYSGRRINSSVCIKKAVEKLINRSELINGIAHHVLTDIGKRSIVEVTLRNNLASLEKQGYYQSPDA